METFLWIYLIVNSIVFVYIIVTDEKPVYTLNDLFQAFICAFFPVLNIFTLIAAVFENTDKLENIVLWRKGN